MSGIEATIWIILSSAFAYMVGLFTGIFCMDRKIENDAYENQADDEYLIDLISRSKKKDAEQPK